MLRFLSVAALVAGLATGRGAAAQAPATAPDTAFVRQHYVKQEYRVPMRDGTKLFTTLYVPRDAGRHQRYPFLLTRTPYSVAPYGPNKYRQRGPGPTPELSREKFIFVYQDVRGRYQSEGEFEEMTPHVPAAHGKKSQRAGHDESTDTYDTIEWLLGKVAHHNGRVGMVGISYPGFYASAALPDAHPALKAVSPQAPVTDEFMGDDANHKGAFFLLDNFGFINYFDAPRQGPTSKYEELFAVETPDAYQFFLQLGPLKNSNSPQYFNNRSKIWNEYLTHSTYDAYWQARNIRPHLRAVRPAVLVVGGWYDAEDLFGALNTYKAIESQSPGSANRLVMGPWTHGAWARPEWNKFGAFGFGSNTAQFFRAELELQFFNHYLKDKGDFAAAEATVFDTGTNQWQRYEAWPPRTTAPRSLFLQPAGSLAFEAPTVVESADSYESDPANPVPYTDGVHARRNNEYMIEDQRFAARRPDVLTYQTAPLTDDLTVAGPLAARLFVSTTGTDADFIVKLIDVLPDTARLSQSSKSADQFAGYQRLVRAEPIRGKFRNSFEQPAAFMPGQVAEVKYELPDVLHTFKKGHRLMVQVQSSWFPLIDRNPQTFVNIPQAEAGDFQKATIQLYHDAQHPSALSLPVVR